MSTAVFTGGRAMSDSPLDHKMHISVFRDLGAKRIEVKKLSCDGLIRLIERTEGDTKRDLPLLKMAEFGDKPTNKGSLRHDDNILSIDGVEGDYDAGEMSPKEASRLLRAAGIAGFIYTTPSHTKRSPRWRVLCPLSETMRPDQRTWMLGRVNGALKGVLGSESFKLTQSYYFGSTTDRQVEIIEVDGEFVDLMDELDDHAIIPSTARPADDGEDLELIPLDEARELFDEDVESGKLDSALDFALVYRDDLGNSIDDGEDRNEWWRDICWALHHGSGGEDDGQALWFSYAKNSWRAQRLTARRESVKAAMTREWRLAKDERPKGVIGLGTIYHRLKEYGWDWHNEGYDIVAELADDDEEDDSPYPRPSDREIDRMLREDDPVPEKVDTTDGNPLRALLADVPPHLLTIPGVLGGAVDHFNNTAPRYQPQFAVQSALALGSVILARNFKVQVSGKGTFSNLYMMNLAESGAGKEHTRQWISGALEEAGLIGLLGHDEFASKPGMFASLFFKPRQIGIVDEIGMRRAADQKSPDSRAEQVQSALTSIYGAVNSTMMAASYTMNGKSAKQVKEEQERCIVRPSLTMVGMSTPDRLFDTLTYGEVTDGYLNRILAVVSPIEMHKSQRNIWKPIPSALKDWMRDWALTEDTDDFDDPMGMNLGDDPMSAPEPEVFKFTPEAQVVEDDIESEFMALAHSYKDSGMMVMFVRCHEMALKLAMIVAASCGRMKIRPSDLEWARDYIRYYQVAMVDESMKRIGASPMVRLADRMAELITDRADRGLRLRDAAREIGAFRALEPRDRDALVSRLETDFDIVRRRIKTKGRPTEILFASQFAPDPKEGENNGKTR